MTFDKKTYAVLSASNKEIGQGCLYAGVQVDFWLLENYGIPSSGAQRFHNNGKYLADAEADIRKRNSKVANLKLV